MMSLAERYRHEGIMENRTYTPRIHDTTVEIEVPSIEVDVANEEEPEMPEMDIEPDTTE